jgi:hypothetical protein
MALHNRALHNLLRCAIPGLLLLAGVAATTDADAQRRRMPVRTEEVPDTESGRPAASAERPAFKGRMIIFGPQELPIGAPPEHSKRPDAEPVAVPKPAPIAEPKPAPAQIAAPAPAPTPPPAQVAVPAPAPTPPAPVAVPLPAQVAVPAPAPTPPPAPVVVVPAPTPPPAPVVVVPAPTPQPAPVVVAPPTPPPASAAAPIRAAPAVAPIAAPSRPAAPAAPPRQEVALAAPSSAAAPPAPMAIEAKLIESIFNCLSPGLPPDWKRAWVEIIDQGGGREKQAKFRVSNIGHASDEGEPLEPCNARALTGSIVSLNEKLPPDRRAWSRALLVIESDGEYELTYDYPK